MKIQTKATSNEKRVEIEIKRLYRCPSSPVFVVWNQLMRHRHLAPTTVVRNFVYVYVFIALFLIMCYSY